jgi:hypothetical protein
MAAEQYIELLNFTTGSRLAIITGATGGSGARNGFLRATTTRQVNSPGLLRLELPADHPSLPLADKTQVVVWRRDTRHDVDWYREFVGLFRDEEHIRTTSKRTTVLLCPGLMSILGWYHVLWDANTANRTVFTTAKAETVMKTLATYNATSSATTGNGRDRTAPLYGISVEADAAGGNTIDWTASRTHTLLEELQAIAKVAGGDFDLEYTNGTTRTFTFYSGQLGDDLSATVTFAENLGNMDNIKFQRTRSTERTAAVVGGQGAESSRDIVVRTGANYSSGNDIETFVDARNVAKGSTAALQARGDKRLDELEARDVFTFDVVQTDGIYYQGSYRLGDLVSAVRPDDVKVTQQVYRVVLDYTPDGEDIKIETRTL